jgi:arsenate reductase
MTTERSKQRVLFLCTGNSCRSQMAEGFLRDFGGDAFEVESAGVDPTRINPLAVRVMAEAAIDISRQYSKSVDEMTARHFDYVITVCDRAREACPVFPRAARSLHWSFEDPAEATGAADDRLAVFRRVRDEIGEQVREFISSIDRGRDCS